jgi:hypothetical protein
MEADMTIRQNFALLAAAAAAIALAGCTSTTDTAPDDATATPAATSGCTPDAGEISWGKLGYGDNVPVGVQVSTYSLGGTLSETTTIDLQAEPEFSGDGINMVSRFDHETRLAWQDALLDDVHRTGQVGDDFGDPIVLGQQPYVTSEPQPDGAFVTSVESTQAAMPFTIDCGDGQAPFEGTIYAVPPGATASMQLSCSADNTGATENQQAALEYCP